MVFALHHLEFRIFESLTGHLASGPLVGLGVAFTARFGIVLKRFAVPPTIIALRGHVPKKLTVSAPAVAAGTFRAIYASAFRGVPSLLFTAIGYVSIIALGIVL